MGRETESWAGHIRLSDYMGIGVIAKTFPFSTVTDVLATTRRGSVRKRDLPADIMMYYVIIAAIYRKSASREMLRCLLEGLHWLSDPGPGGAVARRGGAKIAGKSGISQARSRLGIEPVQRLHDRVVRPIAGPSTQRAWYRRWHLVTLDKGVLAVGDDPSNAKTFGRSVLDDGHPSRPAIGFVSLVEYGTHVLFGSHMAGHGSAVTDLARHVLPHLREDMLCLAEKSFFDVDLWNKARHTGADLLWQGRSDLAVEPRRHLADGSVIGVLSNADGDGPVVRVIPGPDPSSMPLVTSILDINSASSGDLVDLYGKRCAALVALDKMKTYMNKSNIILRSKKPDLVRQEFYGMMMAHFAMRCLIHDIVADDDLHLSNISSSVSDALSGRDLISDAE